MSSRPKYPGVVVKLSGRDGNAFAIVNRCAMAMTAYGVKAADVRQFRNEALAGDYNHVLSTCMRWVQTR